jgi:hypothetical protein
MYYTERSSLMRQLDDHPLTRACGRVAFLAVILAGLSGRAMAQNDAPDGSPLPPSPLDTFATPQNVAALEGDLIRIAGDSSLPGLFQFVLNNFSDELTPYEQQLLLTATYISENAGTLDPSSPNYQVFANFLLSAPAVKAIIADGQRTQASGALLQVRNDYVREALIDRQSSLPPTPEESCGNGRPSSIAGATLDATNSGVFADAGNAYLQTTNVEDLRTASPAALGTAQAPADLANLPLVDANGNPLPVFNFGKFFKGVVEVAAAVVGGAATVVSGGVLGGVVLGVAAAILGASTGVADIIDGANSPSTGDCYGTAPACDSKDVCAVGQCSFNCCTVAGTSAALVSSNLVQCTSEQDCNAGEACSEGCCELVPS